MQVDVNVYQTFDLPAHREMAVESKADVLSIRYDGYKPIKRVSGVSVKRRS